MIVSKKIHDTNIVAYLLYMWQIEDLIRANCMDLEKLKINYISRLGIDDEKIINETEQWYANIIDMMRQEGVVEKGHIQINKNVIISLTDLHLRLIASTKFPYYSAAYYKALPYIVELRAKGEKQDLPEIEYCFDLLYGIALLKMQKKDISEQTSKAVADVTVLMNMLSDYYQKEKNGELELED